MRCRYSVEAKSLLEELDQKELEEVDEWLANNGRIFAKKEDVQEAIQKVREAKHGFSELKAHLPKEEEKQVIVKGMEHFHPIAKDYEGSVEVDEKRDVTNKSRTKGTVKDFVKLFRNRFQRIASLFTATPHNRVEVNTKDFKSSKYDGEMVSLIAMVTEKRETKKGNLLLEVEDLEGSAIVIIRKEDENLFENAESISLDSVIRVEGRLSRGMLIAEEVSFPGVPLKHQQPSIEKDVAVLYLSDLHFGSRYTIESFSERLSKWLKDPIKYKELASRVKYVVVAGDVVDGVGIYPGQETELTVKDVYKQYELFDNFVESLPDYIEVIVAPGNHDAVRRGEPMPAISKDAIKTDVYRVGNPAYVTIDEHVHLIYHGTSFDSMIASVPGLSYTHPETVMRELLKRRHLSPIYGTNPIIPENIDYMVIDKVPDIFHTGHVHTNGQGKYRGVVMINSGTFQGVTPYQVKLGHVPTPGKVPYYNLKSHEFKLLNLEEAIA